MTKQDKVEGRLLPQLWCKRNPKREYLRNKREREKRDGGRKRQEKSKEGAKVKNKGGMCQK